MPLPPAPLLPPAFVVYGLDHARAALAPGRPITLLSSAGAASHAGCGWWRALVAASGTTGPDILDCGDAPGRAMEALRLGCRLIVLAPDVPAFGLLQARAAAVGSTLLPARPPALDLGDPRAFRRLASWLDTQ